MAFQGMVREALYSKCIYRSPRYHDLDLFEISDYLIGLFFNAVGYTEPESSPASLGGTAPG